MNRRTFLAAAVAACFPAPLAAARSTGNVAFTDVFADPWWQAWLDHVIDAETSLDGKFLTAYERAAERLFFESGTCVDSGLAEMTMDMPS